jgi:Zn-dependent M28 family amino/carboxypeptidase
MGRILASAYVAACAAAAGLIASAPAQADPPQCDNGPIVVADCPAGGLCTAMINDQCVGAVVPPLLPPPPPVRVGLEGGVGVGI